MDQEIQKPGWKGWRYMPLVYFVLAAQLAKWVIRQYTGEFNLFKDDQSVITASEGKIDKSSSDYDPDLIDTSYSLNYLSEKEKALRESEKASRESELAKSTAAARPGGGPTAAGGAKTAGAAAQLPARGGKEWEADFLRKNDPELKRYQTYLRNLGQKYWNKYPIVRKVDSDFAKMDRYMALKGQYEQDRDAYKWARGVMALPEVREKLLGYMANPEVMTAGIGMALEALKNPPPTPILEEMLRFITTDQQASNYVAGMSDQAAANMGTVMPYIASSGLDLTPLQKIGMQISSGSKNRAGGR